MLITIGAVGFSLLASSIFARSATAAGGQAAQASVPVAPPTAGQAQHEFVYVADHALKSVHVAGTFNGWNKDADAMRADADGRTWRLTRDLPYGRQQYKFVLTGDSGETWIPDPHAKSFRDPDGNTNSLLTLLPADYARPARPDDGEIAASALLHETGDISYLNYDRGALTFALRARPNDLRGVTLLANGKPVAMTEPAPIGAGDAADELYTRYVVRVPWDRKADLAYTFSLSDGTRTASFGASGLADERAKAAPFVVSAKTFQPFAVPAWVEKSVLYQIFPDRFADGDKRNDPLDVVAWDAKPTYSNRFGGDAAGVKEHLDYLSGLGVSAVYFNPVFASPSNHRYDATDYKKIDPQFGTNAEFADLTRAMKARGIRTVMDYAFNHTATNFSAFADVKQKGAASPYKDWYFVHSYPVHGGEKPNYDAWFGFESMPKLNVLNPATRDYLLGVADFWENEIPLGGMRLDAANEVNPAFWRLLRMRVKTAHPDTWIVGEVWGDGTPWLGGDQWDSVMDYPFRDACIHFFAEGTTKPTEFTGSLMTVYNRYAPQVSRNLMNLLSSHDTPRFLTLCKSDFPVDRLAVAVQFTWAGTPSIYYGDELGMEGGADPDDRRGMRWDLANAANPMLAYYKRLIAARNASPALQSGDPVVLLADDAANTLAYARVWGNDVALVALNRSSESRMVTINLPPALHRKTGYTLTDALTEQHFAVAPGQSRLELTLPADTAMVLLASPGAHPTPRPPSLPVAGSFLGRGSLKLRASSARARIL